ncbi:MAG: AGE family epimerase/isomerase [Lachnospiraceae bacterium]|jgi:mannobiose 2-epimerase|nr:AGE family epimerase/isomerase [Lachnospiraceae bacterium]
MTDREFLEQITAHVKTKIIPFWEGLRDDENGGFYGGVDFDLHVDRKAAKGVILNSRIVWFFSRGYLTLGDPVLLDCARHGYEFMKQRCFDAQEGGVFWSVKFDGTPEDTTKHTYNQAFSIYALSEYYEASKDPEALALAKAQFRTIEDRCFDGGYLEALDRNFRPVSNDKLSENGVLADRTMNTLLHVFEAYTNLYRVSRDSAVKERLEWIMTEFAQKVWNPELRRQEVFFDRDMHSILDLYSYGHDIETSWLMDFGVEVLGEPAYRDLIAPISDAMLDNLTRVAYDGHSLPQECDRGVVNNTRVWWVQAETVLGYLNGALKHPERPEYMENAKSTWEYIRTYIVDPREGGEWFWDCDADNVPSDRKPIVEPWKCPYHNGRMCFEVIRRLGGKTEREEV